MVKRFDIFLLNLDPSPSEDAKNTRPCVVVSPDEINQNIDAVIIAPISSKNQNYPTRINFDFLDKQRAVILDQIRTVEKDRLVQKIGKIKGTTTEKILNVLQEMFTR